MGHEPKVNVSFRKNVGNYGRPLGAILQVSEMQISQAGSKQIPFKKPIIIIELALYTCMKFHTISRSMVVFLTGGPFGPSPFLTIVRNGEGPKGPPVHVHK